MYRIRASDLINAELTYDELAHRVESYSERPFCDGISLDNAGNIYIRCLQTKSVGVIRPDRSYSTLITDPRISWPESFSFGPDGYRYFVASQLHLSAPLNEGKNKAIPAFYVFRIKPLAPGTVGRKTTSIKSPVQSCQKVCSKCLESYDRFRSQIRFARKLSGGLEDPRPRFQAPPDWP